MSASPRPPAKANRRGRRNEVKNEYVGFIPIPGRRRGLSEKAVGEKTGGNAAGNSTENRACDSGNNAQMGKNRFAQIIFRVVSFRSIFWGS